jgi:regulator of protease activity HflC (stomatin/prohibitin superfamily)
MSTNSFCPFCKSTRARNKSNSCRNNPRGSIQGLQKERQEADRKRIEAEGIRDFQKTVTAGISQQLLTWKGIEATEKLADSQNTKIVIIGNTKNGLPLVMQ